MAASALASQCRLANVSRVAKVSRRSARRVAVVAQAKNSSNVEVSKAAAATIATLPALLAASPAFALVDSRLNGDGAGIPLGINDSILGWILFVVFIGVWAVWFNGQKDLGEFDDEDSGLSL